MKIKLKSIETLQSAERISSIDVFRSLAIISVVLFHFNKLLPYGNLGVDLFFVISGLLVGGILTKEFQKGKKINFFKFFLQRGFKIWPSYYSFLFAGTLLAVLFYSDADKTQIIPFWDLKRYLLFYQNYTGAPFHWSFDHVWSLCVEEHFYIMLPILFILLQRVAISGTHVKYVIPVLALVVVSGILFKYLSLTYTHGKDTYSATHNRIDALAWGVLLNIIINLRGEKLKSNMVTVVYFFAGLVVFLASVYFSMITESVTYHKIIFHSVVPFSFFLMILGLYYVDFSRLTFLRFIAYYSYNWYLWHPVFSLFIIKRLGNTPTGLMVYLLVTFFMAMLMTILIEEFFLSRRRTVINKLFKR